MCVLTECWEWKGGKDRWGYGRKHMRGRQVALHRLAYSWANGAIPDGLSVLHSCDNPACVNPRHLFLGDAKANAEDMVNKGRHANQVKTHCPKGHEYSFRGNGWRWCKVCDRERKQKR